jgi:hypothetical protein
LSSGLVELIYRMVAFETVIADTGCLFRIQQQQ